MLNCWIEWNSAVLCCDLNDFFTLGYERLPDLRPLLATMLWSPRIQCHVLAGKKKHVTVPILKPTDDQKPETFWGALTLTP